MLPCISWLFSVPQILIVMTGWLKYLEHKIPGLLKFLQAKISSFFLMIKEEF